MITTRTAGDPDDEKVVFTDLTPTRLEQQLEVMETPASDDLIRQWMEERNLRLRKIRKSLPGGVSPDRDAQFLRIAELVNEYKAAGNPYFSVDTQKQKSSWANFFGKAGSVATKRLRPSITTSPRGPKGSSCRTEYSIPFAIVDT